METLNDPAYMPPGRADVTELMVNEFFLHLLSGDVVLLTPFAHCLQLPKLEVHTIKPEIGKFRPPHRGVVEGEDDHIVPEAGGRLLVGLGQDPFHLLFREGRDNLPRRLGLLEVSERILRDHLFLRQEGEDRFYRSHIGRYNVRGERPVLNVGIGWFPYALAFLNARTKALR